MFRFLKTGFTPVRKPESHDDGISRHMPYHDDLYPDENVAEDFRHFQEIIDAIPPPGAADEIIDTLKT